MALNASSLLLTIILEMCWVYLMKEKSNSEKIFKNFHAMVKTQFQGKIQVLHTDNGKEYFNSILGPYLLNHGIVHQSSCINTPQQNGIAERKNRHILEVAHSIMFASMFQRIIGVILFLLPHI